MIVMPLNVVCQKILTKDIRKETKSILYLGFMGLYKEGLENVLLQGEARGQANP